MVKDPIGGACYFFVACAMLWFFNVSGFLSDPWGWTVGLSTPNGMDEPNPLQLIIAIPFMIGVFLLMLLFFWAAVAPAEAKAGKEVDRFLGGRRI